MDAVVKDEREFSASVKELGEEEVNAREKVVKAQADGGEKVLKAREKAQKILEDAVLAAEEERKKILAVAEKDLLKKQEKIIADARKEAEKMAGGCDEKGFAKKVFSQLI